MNTIIDDLLTMGVVEIINHKGAAAFAAAAARRNDVELARVLLRIRQSEAIPAALATSRPRQRRALRAAGRGRAAPRARRPFAELHPGCNMKRLPMVA